MIRTRALASCATAGLLTCLTLTGTAVADGTSAQLTDASFLQAVHQGNLAEIAAGLDAERHGHSGCVRDTARVLVRDHRRLDDGVRALATALHITLPAGPTAQQRAQLAAVIAKAATRGYDGAWLSLQAAGHEGVLKLIDAETTTSHNAKVIAAASSDAVLPAAIATHSASPTSSRPSKVRSALCPATNARSASLSSRAAGYPPATRSHAAASIASPADTARRAPKTDHAVARPRRVRSPSITSSWTTEKLCTSSTAAATGTASDTRPPSARAPDSTSAPRSR